MRELSFYRHKNILLDLLWNGTNINVVKIHLDVYPKKKKKNTLNSGSNLRGANIKKVLYYQRFCFACLLTSCTLNHFDFFALLQFHSLVSKAYGYLSIYLFFTFTNYNIILNIWIIQPSFPHYFTTWCVSF